MRAVNLKQEIAQDGAAEDSYGEPGDADTGREENAAENDGDVVDDRRERRDDKLAFGVLDGGEDAALVKTNLRGKHDAGEEDDALAFSGIEARGDEFNELGRENFSGSDECDQNKTHYGDYGGKGAPAFVFPFFGDVHCEDGNEGDAERAAGDQVIQKIRKCKGGVVGVGDGVGADLMRDGPFAEEAEHATEQNARHD